MKISELIKELEVYKLNHGDVEVTTKEERTCDMIEIIEGYGTKYGEFIYLAGEYKE